MGDQYEETRGEEGNNKSFSPIMDTAAICHIMQTHSGPPFVISCHLISDITAELDDIWLPTMSLKKQNFSLKEWLSSALSKYGLGA